MDKDNTQGTLNGQTADNQLQSRQTPVQKDLTGQQASATPLTVHQNQTVANEEPKAQIDNPAKSSPVAATNDTGASSIDMNNVKTQYHSFHHPPIQPLLPPEPDETNHDGAAIISVPMTNQTAETPSQRSSPIKAIVTKVKLTDELNIFDWFRTNDIINQIAEKAKSSVDSVITVLDPGMKEYLYSGGNVNIIVIGDSESSTSLIRDAFQTVFGRATVASAKRSKSGEFLDYPVKLASGFDEAAQVARERIRKIRCDTNNIPQNQVVVVVQPSLVNVYHNNDGQNDSDGGGISSKWFLTYCMMIEDPVIGSIMTSYSQLIPVEFDIIAQAKEGKFPEGFTDVQLGFSTPIEDLMTAQMGLTKPSEPGDEDNSKWLTLWSGLNECDMIYNLALTLAHMYKRSSVKQLYQE